MQSQCVGDTNVRDPGGIAVVVTPRSQSKSMPGKTRNNRHLTDSKYSTQTQEQSKLEPRRQVRGRAVDESNQIKIQWPKQIFALSSAVGAWKSPQRCAVRQTARVSSRGMAAATWPTDAASCGMKSFSLPVLIALRHTRLNVKRSPSIPRFTKYAMA